MNKPEWTDNKTFLEYSEELSKYYDNLQKEYYKKTQEEQEKKWDKIKQQNTEYLINLPSSQRPGYITKQIQERQAKGEIVDTFIKQRWQAQMGVISYMLLFGMISTILCKGFIFVWIAMIGLFIFTAYTLTKRALDEDQRRWK